MKPDVKPWDQLTFSEKMRRADEQVRTGYVEPVEPVTVPERSPEERRQVRKELDALVGTITPERAIELNAEIRRMRDEEWD